MRKFQHLYRLFQTKMFTSPEQLIILDRSGVLLPSDRCSVNDVLDGASEKDITAHLPGRLITVTVEA